MGNMFRKTCCCPESCQDVANFIKTSRRKRQMATSQAFNEYDEGKYSSDEGHGHAEEGSYALPLPTYGSGVSISIGSQMSDAPDTDMSAQSLSETNSSLKAYGLIITKASKQMSSTNSM